MIILTNNNKDNNDNDYNNNNINTRTQHHSLLSSSSSSSSLLSFANEVYCIIKINLLLTYIELNNNQVFVFLSYSKSHNFGVYTKYYIA